MTAEPGSRVALSTIGMSAYNLIAARGGQATLVDLVNLLPGVGCRAHPIELAAALKRLLELERVRIVADGVVGIRDPQCRRAVSRARDGDGWADWLVQDARRGLMHLDREVLA